MFRLKKSFNSNLMLRYTVKLTAKWKLSPRKLPPMKIASYENTYLWKFPPLKIPPSENRPQKNCPQENYPQKINSKRIVLYESCHHSCEKLKVVAMQSICSHEK